MGWGRRDFVKLAALLRRPRPRARIVAGPPRSAARTDVGRVRTVNEDRVLDRGDAGLWAVADGMGGMHAGDVAAQAVVDALAGLVEVTEATIAAVLRRASAAIHADAGGRSGATIVAAHVVGGSATILWAGDSRAYHVRGDAVRCVTRDHSVVQDLVDAGLLDPADADGHPRANVITRAIGVTPDVTIDIVRVTLEAGDRLLLCSDGVSRSLVPADLAERLPVDALADRLLSAALTRDGSDNASLIVVEI